MTNLYDVLEACLQEIENGSAVETVLLKYPDLVDELNPILQTAVAAKGLSSPDPSDEIVRRNRVKVLQHAAQMRETQETPSLRQDWFAPVRRIAFTFAVLTLMFVSGTSLVGAASTSLPGDELYPVKRSWERLQVIFLLDQDARTALEVDHENERIDELQELLASKRTAEVTFRGLVTRQNENEWLVGGIRVQMGPEAELPDEPVPLQSGVRVTGWTQVDGTVLATTVELLSSDANLPEYEDQRNDNAPDLEPVNLTPGPAANPTPDNDELKFEGVLDVQNGDFWMINGVPSDVSNAEVIGTPSVGVSVIVEGYFDSDGVFIVTKITFEENDANNGSGSNSNTNTNDNENDNSNDSGDSEGGNDNDNDNDSNEGDDNSGPGGGGGDDD